MTVTMPASHSRRKSGVRSGVVSAKSRRHRYGLQPLDAVPSRASPESCCAPGSPGPARTRRPRARSGSRPSSAAPGRSSSRRTAAVTSASWSQQRRARRDRAATGATPTRPAASRAAAWTSSRRSPRRTTLVTGPRTWTWRPSRYHGNVADAYGVAASCVALGGVVVGEEGDAGLVHALAQHRAGDGPARRVDRADAPSRWARRRPRCSASLNHLRSKRNPAVGRASRRRGRRCRPSPPSRTRPASRARSLVVRVLPSRSTLRPTVARPVTGR